MTQVSAFFFAFACALSMAWSGTSVGNFNFKRQIDFDFQIGFPENWSWKKETLDVGPIAERWSLSNSAKTPRKDRVSSAEVAFLRDFPARNAKQLLEQLRKLHPDLNWSPLKNPDFPVGFRSEQVIVGEGRTHSYEYYFSEERKVVRLEVQRDANANGAAELDLILDSIRRPSSLPRILSIQSDIEPGRTLKVGDSACYLVKIESDQESASEDRVTEVEFEDLPKYWSFKRVQWDPKTESFRICAKINSRFQSGGFALTGLEIASGSKNVNCRGSRKELRGLLECKSTRGNLHQVAYQIPGVVNPTPARAAPLIHEIKVGRTAHSLRFNVFSARPLAIGEIVIDDQGQSEKRSQVLYPDQMQGSSFEIDFDLHRLKPGFVRVTEIMLVDDVGNSVLLKAESPNPRYRRYSSDQAPAETNLPVVSLMGGHK